MSALKEFNMFKRFTAGITTVLLAVMVAGAEVGIYNPTLAGGKAQGIMAIKTTLEEADIKAEEFSMMSIENLLKYKVVIFSNTQQLSPSEDPRWIDNLRAYVVEAGGAAVFCHDAIGATRSPFGRVPLFPEIVEPESIERAETHKVKVLVHQQPDEADVGYNYLPNYEFNQVVEHMYYDHFTFTQTEGTTLLADIGTGKSVLGVAKVGKGRVVFNGMFGGHPALNTASQLDGIDRDALVSTVKWALEGNGPVLTDASLVMISEWRPETPEVESKGRVAVIGMPTFDVRERAQEKINWIVDNDFIPFHFLGIRDLTTNDYDLIIVFSPQPVEEQHVPDTAFEKIVRFTDSGGKAIIFLSAMRREMKAEEYFMSMIGSRYTGSIGRDNPDNLRSFRWTDSTGITRENNDAIGHSVKISEPEGEGVKTVGYWHNHLGEQKNIAIVKAPFGYIALLNSHFDHRSFTAPAMAELAPKLGNVIFRHMLIKYEDVKKRVEATELSPDGHTIHKGALLMEKTARESAEAEDFIAANRILLEAETELVKAYAVSMPVVRGEQRKVFTWARELPDPDIILARLAQAGFTGVNLTHMEGHYPSKYYDERTPDTDWLQVWIDAGQRHGIKIAVEFMPFLVYPGTETFNRALKEDWRAVTANMYGKKRPPIREGAHRILVCRSRPEVVELAISRALEVVENYDVDHISFDYIRWSETCYCDACREQFEKHTGLKVENWPDDAMGKYVDEFFQWRGEPITAVVRNTSERMAKINPDATLGVFTRGGRGTANKGQFWWEWTNYVDYFHPMIYGPDNEALERTMAEINSLIPDGSRARLMPALAPPGDRRGSYLTKLQQIDLQRKYAPEGIMYFCYHLLTDYWLELLRIGPWRDE